MTKVLRVDKFREMFLQQEDFMRLLKEHRGFSDWPVDITTKIGQKECRDIGLNSIEEFFEALAHLKNWKKHRKSEVQEFDRSAFLEELSDMMHYFVELLLMLGVTPEEFYRAYTKKGDINEKRIKGDY
jgi:dimeric dUTPase (all-alpha-NTP-PPase superfamily)